MKPKGMIYFFIFNKNLIFVTQNRKSKYPQ